MASVPKNYPVGCTDEEIQSVASEISREILDSNGNINVVLRLSPIISIGQSELQRRIMDNNQLIMHALHEEVKKQSESSNKNDRASKRVSYIALAISVLSIFIAIYFSVQSDQQNIKWQESQIDLLQKLVNK